jgi:beta-lactam-binding protein with PASTA domain
MPVKTETEKGKESRRDSLEPAAGKKRHQTILIAVAALLAIALAVTLFRSVLGSFEKPSDQYVVKSVLGLTVEEAEETNGIKDIFTITVAEDPVFSEYPVGTIAKQDPKEGEHRTGDRTEITVWLSAGEDVGTMIDVTKKFTFAQARSELKALTDKYDLVLEEPTEESKVFHDEIEAGYIVSTVPAADEPLKKGDTIQFVISKGKEIKPVTVRNYVGLQLSVAREIAAEQKLLCTDMDVEAVYSERPGGEIVWQSIPKDTEALEGDTIQFHVSSGLAPANVQLEIKLPQDRNQVLVEVYVGDDPEPQYREPLSCADEIAKVPLTGSGTQYVKVYFDGLLNQEETQYVPFG